MRNGLLQLILLIFMCAHGRIAACSCVGKRSVKEELKHADAVVVGTIISKQIVTLTDAEMQGMFPNDTVMSRIRVARYRLYVQDIYKGEITSDTLTIYTGLGGGDCGIRFETGEKYIVYGERKLYFGEVHRHVSSPEETNTFWTHTCMRTTPYVRDEITEIETISKKQNR